MSFIRSTTATVLVCLGLVTCRTEEELSAPAADDPPIAPALVAAAAGGAATLVGAGNIASCKKTGDEATAALLDALPGTVFADGDNAYDRGTLDQYLRCYEPTWGRHKARTRPAPGHRDYQTAGATGYFGYFGTAAGTAGSGYYSYDLGAWHVIVLNSNIAMSRGSAQEQWLRADLAARPAQCTVAYWHHPLFFSKGTSGQNAAVQPLWEALYAAGVELAVNAHYGFYERFAPQRPDGGADPATGIREFIVGTGGAESTTPDHIRPNSEVRDGATAGVLRLTLDTAGYAWEFVPVAGKTFRDSGSGACHGPPPPSSPSVDAGPDRLTAPGDTLALTFSFTDSGFAAAPWSWVVTWGDGAQTTGSTATASPITTTHVFATTGSDSVRVTVTNNRGGTGSDALLVTVSETVTLVGAGDIADCTTDGDSRTASILDTVPGTVVALGDNAYPNGSTSDFTNCYDPTWGRHKARTRPVPGNHEYQTANAAGYFGYFGAAAGDPAQGYYSYDLGAWHIVALNSEIAITAGSPQEQWLKADLAASTKQCTLAYWHHPLFSSNTLATDPNLRAAWIDLYDAGAEIVLAGHHHDYERFAPQTADSAADAAFGIREFVVGTGGEDLFGFGGTARNSEVKNATTFGVLRLTLSPSGYAWKFIPIAGQTFTDAGTGSCHGTPASSGNQAPTANPGGPYSGTSGSAIAFDGSASFDPDGDALTYAWTFGDGGTATTAQPAHTYAAAGSYAVRLTVTDARGAASQPATTSATITTPGGGTTVTLIGAGNIARCDRTSDEATAAILDTLPGTVFVLGDNASPGGTPQSYATCYDPTWGRQKARSLPVIGHHEYDSSTTAAGYFGYFGAAAGDPSQGYYSLDLGAWHIVVLNSNATRVSTALGSAQEQWLRSDLAATAKQCVIALFHHPRFYSTTSATFSPTSSVKPFWDDLYAAGAELVVNAHMRDYERFAPQNAAGAADSLGIREFVVGTGGEGLDATNTLIIPNSERNISQVYGVLKLTLGDGTYAWQFIPVAGQTATDTGSGTCH